MSNDIDKQVEVLSLGGDLARFARLQPCPVLATAGAAPSRTSPGFARTAVAALASIFAAAETRVESLIIG
ncbi:MAG: hypothetical protein JO110_09750 [Acetobacteraceae bacterium]|nr:hypothetical protein [Acetobacteraceae bacterium]